MNIEITKEEYRDLLDILHMAEWMMHAHETERDSVSAPYDRVIQKLYGLAKAMGQESLVSYDADAQEYFPTREFDDTTASWEIIDQFTEETFWDELIHRLTDRDLARAAGGYEQLENLSMSERFIMEAPVIERYSQEFEQRGLERLEVVAPAGAEDAAPPVTHD